MSLTLLWKHSIDNSRECEYIDIPEIKFCLEARSKSSTKLPKWHMGVQLNLKITFKSK